MSIKQENLLTICKHHFHDFPDFTDFTDFVKIEAPVKSVTSVMVVLQKKHSFLLIIW